MTTTTTTKRKSENFRCSVTTLDVGRSISPLAFLLLLDICSTELSHGRASRVPALTLQHRLNQQ